MRKWLLGTMALGLGLLMVAADGSAGAADPSPDISTIMKKVNGKGGIHRGLKGDIDVASPKWADIVKKTKEYTDLAGHLGKNTPPKGDKTSWDKLTKEYGENVKTLHEAVEKMDKSTALTQHGKISRMCMTCHNAHRE